MARRGSPRSNTKGEGIRDVHLAMRRIWNGPCYCDGMFEEELQDG